MEILFKFFNIGDIMVGVSAILTKAIDVGLFGGMRIRQMFYEHSLKRQVLRTDQGMHVCGDSTQHAILNFLTY